MGVEEKIAHEGYNERSKNRENDIGLVRMNGDVTYTDYIRPICLPTTVNSQRSVPNEKLVSAGWGRTLEGNATCFSILFHSIHLIIIIFRSLLTSFSTSANKC